MNLDAVLIHPPSIYDFRKREIFPSPIDYTVSESTNQFIIPSVGMLSIADYLDRHGYQVMIDNIGERMVSSQVFNVEDYIADISAKVYAIGLHWCVHSQGAIEIARICKKLHPNSLVVMGGLTSTVFAEEIVANYNCIDAVIRGEAEKPFLALMRALEENNSLQEVPNLTFRDINGEIRNNPLMEPSENLDKFEYTRLELLDPKASIFTKSMPPHWSIPISRGCLFNCATCGGSAYSYRKYLGMQKPAFRSPEKIVDDLRKLKKQGVDFVFLFQDPRLGGKEYCNKLISTLREGRVEQKQITLELFSPADEEYIRKLSQIGIPVALSMSPESLVGSVRRVHGRNYTNDDIFKTIKLCKNYGIPIGIFSMFALANDTTETLKADWEIWEQICILDTASRDKVSAHYGFGPMILLDPGSLAFDYPEKYGYNLKFKNLADYVSGMSLPSWYYWISYETRFLNRERIADLIIDSLEYSAKLRYNYGLCFSEESYAALRQLDSFKSCINR